jgi:pyruvate/2-oxoglutarate dehydrogenase complex dihydrolipoamide acyltransferase (E2) component
MRVTIKMPRAADTVDEFIVSEILAEVGAAFAVGDPLLRVETDKALVDIPAPVAGVVVEWLVVTDDEVTTGAPILIAESS